MRRILFRNICKRSVRVAPFMGWMVFMSVIGFCTDTPKERAGLPVWAEVLLVFGVVLLAAVAVAGLNMELPKVLFMMPVSRAQRQQYLKKLRCVMFVFGTLGCAAGASVFVAAGENTFLCALCWCMIVFSFLYTMSYSQYFSYKKPIMQGVEVFFDLLNCGLLAASDFSGGIWAVYIEDLVVAGLIVLTFVIEWIVFHRYTKDMIRCRADYETTVTMYKKNDNTMFYAGLLSW